ncbi:hypothetical protein HY483_01455 [Candidatus Woesearchaeota archaeon]|nr:hypothetical protein [Candidatus Woesearchaeota archaeon]
MFLESPVDFRKKLLETAKIVIKTLQGRQELLRIRDEKEKVLRQFLKSSQELSVLAKKLGSKLPKHEWKRVVTHKVEHLPSDTPPSQKLDVLEREISKIEERIKVLG